METATTERREDEKTRRNEWKHKISGRKLKQPSNCCKFFVIFQELVVGQVTQPEPESARFACSSSFVGKSELKTPSVLLPHCSSLLLQSRCDFHGFFSLSLSPYVPFCNGEIFIISHFRSIKKQFSESYLIVRYIYSIVVILYIYEKKIKVRNKRPWRAMELI